MNENFISEEIDKKLINEPSKSAEIKMVDNKTRIDIKLHARSESLPSITKNENKKIISESYKWKTMFRTSDDIKDLGIQRIDYLF